MYECCYSCLHFLFTGKSRQILATPATPRSKKLGGERKAETNASTLVGVTSHVTISNLDKNSL